MNSDSTSQFQLSAYALAVTNALIIGLSLSFVKIAVTLAGPVDTLVFRFVITWAICFLFALIKGIRRGDEIPVDHSTYAVRQRPPESLQ